MAANLSPPGAFTSASAEPNLSQVKMSALAAIGRYLRFQMARSDLIKMAAGSILARRQFLPPAKGGRTNLRGEVIRPRLFCSQWNVGNNVECGGKRSATPLWMVSQP